jgi:hypothetical protein
MREKSCRIMIAVCIVFVEDSDVSVAIDFRGDAFWFDATLRAKNFGFQSSETGLGGPPFVPFPVGAESSRHATNLQPGELLLNLDVDQISGRDALTT